MAVDPADVEIVLGRALTSAETSRVDRLLQLAAGIVEGELPGFTIEPGTETVDVLASEPQSLWTPRYPVRAINSVAVIDNLLAADTYTWTEKGYISRAWWPLPERIDIDPLVAATAVTVDYDFGFATVPNDVAMAVASMVAAAIARQTNPDRVQSEALGAYQVSYGDWSVREAAAGMTFPAGGLRRWHRTRLLSVPLHR